MPYNLKGSILEVCDCRTLCPCWIGEDADNGTCSAAVAYNFSEGIIDGIDVTGLTIAMTAFIPGNILQGNWRACVYIDERATEKQEAALLSVYSGQQGGPVADLVKLVGEIVEVKRAPIRFEVKEGKGTLRVGSIVEAEMEPYRSPSGEPTRLVDSIFSTIPGSPAYVAKASRYRMAQPALGMDLELKGHNAIQGSFAFQG
jgi:hypothetical protein